MRRVRITAVYLLLGFVTTWAVAWALALLPLGNNTSITWHNFQLEGTPSEYFVGTNNRLGLGSNRAKFLVGHGLPAANDFAFLMKGRVSRSASLPESEWNRYELVLDVGGFDAWGSRLDRLQSPDESTRMSGIDDARGLPFLSHWCSWSFNGRSLPGVQTELLKQTPSGGFSIPGRPNTGVPVAGNVRALPYMPIWSGLALNTAFYAFLFFAVARTLRAFKRSRRHARGLCPRCKYDRQFDYRLPCPECGDAPDKRIPKAQVA